MKKIKKPITDYPNYKKFFSEEGGYEGQISKVNKSSDFVRNGYGIMKYRDGSCFSGYWKNNRK